ncbi:MAG: SDR family NAD(P)-dependent oxidoreductase [Pseudomonadota bacterium]
MSDKMPSHAIAIVGMAGRFPGAGNLEQFWRNIREGVEQLDSYTDEQLQAAGVPVAMSADPRYVRKGTSLEGADEFDAGFFGYSPREAQIIDPQQRIFLECAWEALENAGYGTVPAECQVGVYGGASINTYLYAHLLRDPELIAAVGGYQLMLGNDKDFLCTRVSYKLDLHGPSMTIQTACSTSLVAVQVACRALQRGECTLALAGGVSVGFPQAAGYLYEEGMIFSPDGHCRPFDSHAGGTRASAGAGVVVLKRLADALSDGDTIHAVIRGAAINNDGANKAGFTAPSVDGQVEVIATAQALAGVDPRSITYIEAHGTGTHLGDPIEVAALTQVFRATTSDVGFCSLGSLKANLGHLDAAAGVAGLIKTVLALRNRELPPLVNFASPNPQLQLETSPFVASASASAWTADGPRRAGVSSFGIGGTNAHVVLEEAPAVERPAPGRKVHLLVLSAKSETALDAASRNLASHLLAHPGQSLADIEWTLQVGRKEFAHRRAVVAGNAGIAAAALNEPRRAPVLSARHEGGVPPVVFLFSGQGSQHPGMAASLYNNVPVFREAIQRCSLILGPHLGFDMGVALFGGAGSAPMTAERLNETRIAQPALFVIEYALATLWMSWGVEPHAMIGHSVGEYVAAHLAGVFTLDDALHVIAARGRLMQALPSGSMVAVHLGPDELAPQLGPDLEIAAVNAAELCTVAGPTPAIVAMEERLGAAGVETRRLQTSHAFHSAMMEPVIAPFLELLCRISLKPPQRPYISNLTGRWISASEATSPTYYAEHLRRTVRFEAGVKLLAANAAAIFLEVGPGNALQSLARSVLGPRSGHRVIASLPHARENREAIDAVLEATAKLWLTGARIQWRDLHAGAQSRRVPLPTYPFERQRFATVNRAPAPASASAQENGPSRGDSRGKAVRLFAPTWTRDDSQPAPDETLQGTWLVLCDRNAMTDLLCEGMLAAGGKPLVLLRGADFKRIAPDQFQVRMGNAEDIAAVVRSQNEGPLRGALQLWGLGGESQGVAPRQMYDVLTALAAALHAASDLPKQPVQILHVTTGLHAVMEELVQRAEDAITIGPVLVLPTEFPGLRMRNVDIDSREGAQLRETCTALLREAAMVKVEPIVALRSARRWVLRMDPLQLPEPQMADLPLKPRGVTLITGGLGGIGLVFARWLAESVGARLLLTARTALPPRETWDAWLLEHDRTDRQSLAIDAIREIEASGGEVLVAAADVADIDAMRTAIKEAVARWGGINSVIHSAGIAGDGRLALLTNPEQVDSVLAPKVRGLAVLRELLGDVQLDFVALMGSINGVRGVPGASVYSGANAVLDAFVDSAERPARWQRVVTIDWNAWLEVGMAAKFSAPKALAAQWQLNMTTALTNADGIETFRRVLASGRKRAVAVTYDLTALLERDRASIMEPSLADPTRDPSGNGSESAYPEASEGTNSRPDLPTAFEAPVTETQRRLSFIWTELLGVNGIGIHDNFFDLGGHSLLATRVIARIEGTWGVRLALRDFFDVPTILTLSDKILANEGSAEATQGAQGEDREEWEI